MLSEILNRIAHSDKGASMVEYGLLAVLIAIAAFLAAAYFGGEVADTFSEISSSLEDARS